MSDSAPVVASGSALKNRLAAAREGIAARIGKESGLQLCRRFTSDVDGLLRSHFRHTVSASGQGDSLLNRMALLALGGYGRRELCLYSDVDLLFVFRSDPTAEDEAFVKSFLYPLWDIGVDLGHAVRSEKAAVEVAGTDLDSTTALVENRWLAGSEELRNHVTERLRRKLHSPEGARWYVEAKLEYLRQRHEKYGNSIFVLEPHLKEGCGGLRDLHAMMWLSFVVFGSPTLEILTERGILTATEVRMLHRAMGFLLEVRNALHALESRKSDHLTFERQIRAARVLGYSAGETALAEEQLMREYYAMAQTVQRLSGRAVEFLRSHALGVEGGAGSRESRKRVAGPFFLSRGGWLYVEERHRHRFRKEPDLILKAFSLAAGLGLRVRQDVRDWIASGVSGADDAFRASPVNRDLFLGILRGPGNVFHTLHDMHECGALGAYVPEFDLVRHLPRLDFYHQYTVDEHLLLATRVAEELRTGRAVAVEGPARPATPPPRKPSPHDEHAELVAREIRRWDLFNLALFLHDVGKGEGRGHVIRGAHIMERIAERMGLAEEDRELCRSLVLNHQKMSHLAQRRNVEDPKVAQDLARELDDRELLRMLYVLTVCDLRAVGATVWNDWKGKLLANLYEHTMDCLYKPRMTAAQRRAQLDVTPEKVYQLLAAQGVPPTRKAEIQRFITGMPERYLVSTSANEMSEHYLLAQELTDSEAVQWRLEAIAGQNYSRLTIAARDAPGLFSHICGALASRGINILAAQIYTGTHGICLDLFHIQDQRGQPVEEGGWLDRLRRRLLRALAGDKEAQWDHEAAPTRARKFRSLLTPDLVASRPTSIEFNNSASAHHTVIEIKTHDRPGLLYSITRVMDQERINIDLALIATEAYRVVDVFYVTDWDNNKLEGETRFAHLREALQAAIGGDSAVPAARPQESNAPKRSPADPATPA